MATATATHRLAAAVATPRTRASRRRRPRHSEGGLGHDPQRSVKQFKHDDVTDRAAALTYYGVLAIFPACWCWSRSWGCSASPRPTRCSTISDRSRRAASRRSCAPSSSRCRARPARPASPRSSGSSLALWSASGYVAGVHARLQRDLRRRRGPPDLEDRPGPVPGHARAGGHAGRSARSWSWSPGPIASQVGKAFGIGDTAVLVWDIAKWPVLLVVVSLMFSLLYRACPNVKQPGFRWITPAASSPSSCG